MISAPIEALGIDLHTQGGIAEAARVVGLSRQHIDHHLKGGKVPEPDQREACAALFVQCLRGAVSAGAA
jgi:hypothetical protein